MVAPSTQATGRGMLCNLSVIHRIMLRRMMTRNFHSRDWRRPSALYSSSMASIPTRSFISGGYILMVKNQATGVSMSTMGMPTHAHSRKEMLTDAVSLSRPMVMAFMEEPAGVPTPPMRQAKGRPIIIARPKELAPCMQLFFCRITNATGRSMAMTGISASMEERRPPAIMR